jgi:hypothetical protein
VLKEYVEGVRLLEVEGDDGTTYRFEAPGHCGKAFETREAVELYADTYFAANGFQEAGTGEFGVPIEVIQAGKDVLAAYLATMPGASPAWVGSFYGETPTRIDDYVEWVRGRAEEVRARLREDADGVDDGDAS